MSNWRLQWPLPGGIPGASAQLKNEAEDFQVTELLETGGPVQSVHGSEAVTVPGQGEHLLIYLEKTGDNTPWVAGQLGQMAGCGDAGVGYCGLKDRHAITRQWFSVQRPGLEADDGAFISAVRQQWPVLAVARRTRKLRRSEHYGNRFRICLRSLEGDPGEVEHRLQSLAREGCPNYFGSQRFGHEGGNLDRAVAMARKPPRRRRGRKSSGGRDGLYFSAARSWLFNEVLAERVVQQSWREALDGEPGAEPTGPLWGDGGTTASSSQGELERAVVSRYPDVERVFANTRMAPERRPLVLKPSALEWALVGDNSERLLEVSFTLAPGQYATTLLSSVVRLLETSERP